MRRVSSCPRRGAIVECGPVAIVGGTISEFGAFGVTRCPLIRYTAAFSRPYLRVRAMAQNCEVRSERLN